MNQVEYKSQRRLRIVKNVSWDSHGWELMIVDSFASLSNNTEEQLQNFCQFSLCVYILWQSISNLIYTGT